MAEIEKHNIQGGYTVLVEGLKIVHYIQTDTTFCQAEETW
jgi:hypothetical protein